MDGEVLLSTVTPETVEAHPVRRSSEKIALGSGEDGGYGEDEEEKVRERLRGLGYIQ